MHGVPRIWEKIAAQAFVAIEGSSWIKKVAYRLAMKMERRYLERKWEGHKPSWKWRALRWVPTQIAFRHLLTRLGFSKVRYAFSGGAPLPLATQMLWQTWGLDFINMYGASEAGGLITSERPGFEKPGTVGKPTSICKLRLAEDGEVLVEGPGVFLGYWNDKKTTQETIKDGWLLTGDIAEYTSDGSLRLIDRKKDIMITSGGKNITPSLIESVLKESHYISEAVLIAEGKKFPSALIEIDFDTVSEWGRKNKLLYTSYTSLAIHPKTYDLIAEEVRKCNEKFARVEQVKKFRIIPKELDPEEGDTTATRKIKRKRMYEMFHDLIEEMYVPEKGERRGSFTQ
jgi:long-chain acyl-CoA synthetase